ncbi:MAG: hypothetical protein GY859_12955, partial [Desulfobacterales bacterium]|nr:hypothetical protein [Desulfobacterales bacterium]
MTLETGLRMVSKNDLDRVHEATVEILEQTGVAFHLEEAVEVFKRHGARVDGEVVYISRRMLENAVETAPRTFTWWAREKSNSLAIGGKQERVHVMLDNGPVFVQGLDGGRRPGRMADLIEFYKLGQSSHVCNIIGQIPIDPGDLAPPGKHLHVMYQLLRRTNKPLFGFVDVREHTRQMFDMVEIAMGQKDYPRDHPTIGVSVCALSPLRYDPESCETILAYARLRQPLLILSCAQAGVTAPIGLMGTVILQNAEILAGLVLTQLVNPGAPFVYSPASTVSNMKTAGYITGSPESNLINIVGLQLANERYGFPTRTMAGLTDAKSVDCQAGYESMQNYLMLMLAGSNLINECIGVLDGIMTVSYEKFILDEEMLSRVLRVRQGIDRSDNAFDIDVIREVGRTGSYLLHPETAARCREPWRPTVSCWDAYSDWERDGAEGIAIRANRAYKERLRHCPDALIDAEVDNRLKQYMEKAG